MSIPDDFDDQMDCLLTGLSKECNCYQNILVYSREQNELVAKGDIAGMFPGLTKITEEMATIAELEASIAQAKPLWDSHKDFVEEDKRIAIEQAIEHVSNMLKDILELEAEQQKCIADQQEKTKKNITRLNQGQVINKAYGHNAPPQSPSILDKQS